MAKKKKTRKEKVTPTVESPTWGQLHRLATRVLEVLGGPKGTAKTLNGESFYTLVVLAALNLDAKKAAAPIFGKQYLT